MVNYVASLCWSCFFSAASSGHTLVHAFVSSRLDYTATVYCMESVTVWWRRASGVPEFGGTCSDRYQKFDHITPVLRDLHWLPIRQRKLAVIVFKCLRGLAPSYLSTIVSWPRLLPVGDIWGQPTPWNCWHGELWTVIGARDFAVSAAAIWNSLPASSFETVFLLGSEFCAKTDKNLAIANRSHVSCAHNTSRASRPIVIPWPWNRG